jgi:hypothetical protein
MAKITKENETCTFWIYLYKNVYHIRIFQSINSRDKREEKYRKNDETKENIVSNLYIYSEFE